MKAGLITKINIWRGKPDLRTREAGISTLEMLIALALLSLSISTAVVVSFGNQSIVVDSLTSGEALTKAQTALETAQAQARLDFSQVSSTPQSLSDIYTSQTSIDPASVTQCGENINTQVSWSAEHNRNQNVTLNSYLANFPLAAALGGNCDLSPPTKTWTAPSTWASGNFNPGKPTGLDALNRVVYVTADKAPFLFIADTSTSTLGQSSGLFINFSNGFSAGVQLNDIKVARLSDGNSYAFVARDDTTNQFGVIKVTNKFQPSLIGNYTLANVSSGGSYPQAWRIFYYNNRVYVLTRFTAGPELHIFDVSNPANIHELGSGTDLGYTVNGIAVTEKTINGSLYRFAFLATSDDNKELVVLNVTNPVAVTEITSANRNLSNPDYADGNAVFLLGNKLYFGRDSSSPYDLYVFDASNPLSASGGLPILGQTDIGSSVLGLTVSGKFAFLSTSKTSKEFQVWTSDPTSLTLVNTFNFSNIITNAVKYEQDWVYAASQGNDALRIIYSP